jgi:hypothetical protein
MKNIHIITVTNSIPHKNVHFLSKSLKPYNLIVLQTYDPKIGNLSKIYKVYDYLINSNINYDDVICVVDAHDVVFNNKKRCINDVLSIFNSYNTDIIFSSENTCVHHSNNSKEYFESIYGSNYLNSGISVSIKSEYLKMLESIIKNIGFYNQDNLYSDQRIIGNFITHNKSQNIILDIYNIFSTTLNSKTHLNFTDINSFFIHVPCLSTANQQLKYKNLIRDLNK